MGNKITKDEKSQEIDTKMQAFLRVNYINIKHVFTYTHTYTLAKMWLFNLICELERLEDAFVFIFVQPQIDFGHFSYLYSKYDGVCLCDSFK